MPTALITGASSGIGATFARQLATRQTDLVLVARNEAKLQQLAQELQSQFQIQVEVLPQDLTIANAATTVLTTVTQKNLTIDLLINNAGFGDYGPFAQSSRQRQLEMIQLNILALVDLTYQFLPLMQQRRSGSIINLASTAAFQPLPYLSIYAASKAFVLSFSEALWAENQEYGVKVLALCPGPTETSFFKEANFPQSFTKGSDSQIQTSPEEVVNEALKALAANQSNVVTGGLPNQLLVNASRFLPRETLVKVVEQQFRPKAETPS